MPHYWDHIAESRVDERRVRPLNGGQVRSNGPVIYWMDRDKRSVDNWALLLAQDLAAGQKMPVVVVSCIDPPKPELTQRRMTFLAQGLTELTDDLRKKNIAHFTYADSAETVIPQMVTEFEASLVVSDFAPLKHQREARKVVANALSVPLLEVDAHNVVPVWHASDKQEYAAYTIRPKIQKKLDEFLTEFPKLRKHRYTLNHDWPEFDTASFLSRFVIDDSVAAVEWAVGGEQAGHRMLRGFLENSLSCYSEARNDPNAQAQSNLSPYLNFGFLSAQRAAWEAQRLSGSDTSAESFLEELIVRRELSDNYCLHCIDYGTINGLHNWAQTTLKEHRSDPREHVYTREEFEEGRTHDDLWNAAQMEMVTRGKMHGYMRMYWAKKILEWAATPKDALEIAIYLNDRYELDGCDANGYTGVAWSIGGLHDRAWSEREIFGKIRYMSAAGCRRKFDVDAYISRVQNNVLELS